MWPFKSKIPVVQNVIFENEGDTVTIIHSKGAYKFNKEDVLESHFSTDVYSSPKMNVSLFHFEPKTVSPVFVVLFFGGWLNTLYVLHSQSFLHIGRPIYLIFLAILLSLFTLYFFRFLVKYIHVRYDNNFPKILFFKSFYDLDVTKDYRKDILNISLNNSNLRVRFEWYNRGIKAYKGDYEKLESWYDSMIDLGYLKESSTSRVIIPKEIFSSRKNFVFYKKITFAAVIIFVLFTRWDMPFLSRYFIDENIKLIYHDYPSIGNFSTVEGKNIYWNYFKNSNYILAFYDGMVGVFFNVLTIILIVTSFLYPVLLSFELKKRIWKSIPLVYFAIFLLYNTFISPQEAKTDLSHTIYYGIGFLFGIYYLIRWTIKDFSLKEEN